MNALRRLVGQGPPASQRQLVDHLVRRGALSQAGSRAFNVMQRVDRARFVDAGAQAYKASFRTARFISPRFSAALSTVRSTSHRRTHRCRLDMDRPSRRRTWCALCEEGAGSARARGMTACAWRLLLQLRVTLRCIRLAEHLLGCSDVVCVCVCTAARGSAGPAGCAPAAGCQGAGRRQR
jgi:hypothetical protein